MHLPIALTATTIGIALVLLGAIAAFFIFRTGRKNKALVPGETDSPPEGSRDSDAPKSDENALRKGLKKTREEGFLGRISRLFQGASLDDAVIEQIEEVLFTSDIGVKTSERLLQSLKDAHAQQGELSQEQVWAHLREEALSILEASQKPWTSPDERTEPTVVMMVGVNGTGKTTSTGKLAAHWMANGKSVLLGAGDTFRAAAVEQLQAWGSRVGAPVVAGKAESDPASVLFDATRQMREKGVDILLADTAGRLHTHAGLLDELKKVVRVVGKAMPGAPHEVWLVLDGTTGQNAIQQARIFGEAVDVSGIILTKLDGTAKGGVVLGIADELGLPIRYLGVGEKVDDLRTFDGREFVDALFGDPPQTN